MSSKISLAKVDTINYNNCRLEAINFNKHIRFFRHLVLFSILLPLMEPKMGQLYSFLCNCPKIRLGRKNYWELRFLATVSWRGFLKTEYWNYLILLKKSDPIQINDLLTRFLNTLKSLLRLNTYLTTRSSLYCEEQCELFNFWSVQGVFLLKDTLDKHTTSDKCRGCHCGIIAEFPFILKNSAQN